MKTAYYIALLYIDIAVSAIPTYYGHKDDGKREAWPCKDMKTSGWSKMALTKPNSEAVINSMFKIVKPPCNHRHAVKDVKVPDITQKPEETVQITPKYVIALKNVARKNVTGSQSEPGKPPLMAAATHNKPTTLGNQVMEEDRKVGTFTNIINSKIATPKLAHILPLWIPQRKYFKVRRDDLILRNQKSNSLHKDRQLNSNLQFTILHGPKDFFNDEHFNVEDKMPVPNPWNQFSVTTNAEVKKDSEKMKRQTSGSSMDNSKKLIMNKKELHKSGKFHKEQDVIPYALFYRIPENNDNKTNDLLRYLSEPSTAIYGPYVGTLHGHGAYMHKKRMANVKDIYKS